MAKRYIAIIMAVLTLTLPMSALAAPSFNRLQVNYIYYNKTGGYTVYREEDFDDFNTASIGLFQIAVDDMKQREDGYLYECNTKVWLDGVTEDNSVSITYGNPCAFNSGVSEATMQNPYNMLSIALYLSDGSTAYFDGVGGKNELGNVSVVELAGFGTCEMADEIVVTLIKGVAIDRVDIRVSMFADAKDEPYRPITWWGNGHIEFGEINTVERALERIETKVEEISVSNATIIQQNQTLLDRMTNGFKAIGGQVKTAVTEAVSELFVPDEQSVKDFFTNMNEMEEEHLKPIAQVKDTVNAIEQTLFNPDYDAQITGDLAPVAGYINSVQGNGIFVFPGYEMTLPEGKFTLWEDYVIDVGATLEDMGLSWIPTVTKAICIALFTWRFLIMVLRWLMKITENPTFGQWADMLATFDFNYKTGW